MTTASGDGAGTFLRSRRWQAAAVVTIFLLVAALHAHNDGLWYQGDAPRHAANGFFWWDLLRAMPVNPAGFVLRYYARYPVITPAAYPPFFYLLEGTAFHLFGPSPYTARMLVVAFAILAGLYTMAWARRWVGAWAGWAGVFLAFMPAIVLWSNTVMLNMPSTALGLAGLYHFRRWTEERAGKQLALAAMFVAAALLTYYPGASVVCVCAAWAVWRRARSGWRGLILLAAAGLLALIPLLVSLRLAPVYASRHLPPVDFLLKPANWTFYFTVLPEMLGPLALVLALAGLAAGLLSRRWRGEAMCLLVWIGALLFSLSLLMARDLRYILLTAPAFLIAIAIGLAFAAERLPMPDPRWRVALLLTGLLGGVGASAAVRMPVISGFEAVAAYLDDMRRTTLSSTTATTTAYSAFMRERPIRASNGGSSAATISSTTTARHPPSNGRKHRPTIPPTTW